MMTFLKIGFILAASLCFACTLAIGLVVLETIITEKLRNRRRRNWGKDPEMSWWERKPRRDTDTLTWTLTERGQQLLEKKKRPQ